MRIAPIRPAPSIAMYGKNIIHWFESGGADSTALRFRDLHFYGGWFDTLAALIAAIPINGCKAR